MRKFYIFNINKNSCVLAKDSPYMLYKSFEAIYKQIGKMWEWLKIYMNK